MFDVYELPYNPQRPAVCMDENHIATLARQDPHFLVRPGNDQKVDSECMSSEMVQRSIFASVEPFAELIMGVREHRYCNDWAEEINILADAFSYPDEKIPCNG